MTKAIPRATHYGKLEIIPGVEMDAYVLEDGRRVLSRRGMATALGFGAAAGGSVFANFAASTSIRPYISNDLGLGLTAPIEFKTTHGPVGHGFEATLLKDVCMVAVRAHMDGVLHHTQDHIARQAAELMGAFAHVGIVALVDEATGYQRDRRADELRAILDVYIAENLRPYTRRFPDAFFREMCRLRGWTLGPHGETPRYAGHLVNWLVYDQLPTGVREELQRRNPIDGNGQRRARQHQWVATGDAECHLDRQIVRALALMQAADSWESFERAFLRVHGPPRAPLPKQDSRQRDLFAILSEAG